MELREKHQKALVELGWLMVRHMHELETSLEMSDEVFDKAIEQMRELGINGQVDHTAEKRMA